LAAPVIGGPTTWVPSRVCSAITAGTSNGTVPGAGIVRAPAGTLRLRNNCSNAPGVITPSIRATGLVTRKVCGTPRGM
jgi:hypothetical protein